MLEALAIEHPPWQGEGAIHYAERLNVLAGYLTVEQTGQLRSDEDLSAKEAGRKINAREPWLPYKD
jgi:hypothetical protein